MSTAERIHMCLTEAGFIEGRDYKALYGLDESDGYVFLWAEGQPSEALRAAIDKAREMVGLPSWVDITPYVAGTWTCGDPKERKAV